MDLVAMLQVLVTPRADQAEIAGPGEQLVAGGDVHDFTIEGDATQAAVPAATLPVDAHRVPVEHLACALGVEIHEVHAAMAFALPAAADHRGCDERSQS